MNYLTIEILFALTIASIIFIVFIKCICDVKKGTG